MCRLFAAMATHCVDAEFLLRKAPYSLLAQSHIDKKRKQGDGWGIGYFEDGPQIIKSPRPMYRDHKKLSMAVRKGKGKTLIGHVRWASNPLKLKHSDLIGLTHTQPFTHGRFIFAHNGTLFIPKEVAAELGPWKKYVQGKNDSEVLFYWILKHLVRSPTFDVRRRKPLTSDVARRTALAIRRSLRGLNAVWKKSRAKYPIYKYPYHGLNWVLSDGQTLLAFCYSDPRGFGKSKALCSRSEAYYQLRRQVSDQEVLVASEPMDKSHYWEQFRHGELLVAHRRGSRIVTQTVHVQ